MPSQWFRLNAIEKYDDGDTVPDCRDLAVGYAKGVHLGNSPVYVVNVFGEQSVLDSLASQLGSSEVAYDDTPETILNNEYAHDFTADEWERRCAVG